MRRTHLILLLLALLLLGVLIPVSVTVLGPADPALPSDPDARPAPDLPSGPPAARNAAGESIPLPGTPTGKETATGSSAAGAGPGEDASRPGGASGAGPAGSGESAGADPGAGTAEAKRNAPAGWFPEFEGTVLDVRTGEPVVGARLMYGPFPSYWGGDADEKGGFGFTVPARSVYSDTPFQLRVTAPGYETLTVVPREGKLVVELVPRTGPAMPGRIRGRAEDGDGRPVEGIVSIVLGDETVNRHWLTVLADEHGEFLLHAIDPGLCRIGFEGGAPVNVFVPEDGEVPVTIRAKGPVGSRDFTPETAKRLEERRKEFLEAEMRVAELEKERGAAGKLRAAETERDRVWRRVQGLEVLQKRAATRRVVRITGIPARDGSRLVAEAYATGSTERWWAVVRNGQAEFPVLFAGEWTLILKSEDGERSGRVEVGAERDVAFPGEPEPK